MMLPLINSQSFNNLETGKLIYRAVSGVFVYDEMICRVRSQVCYNGSTANDTANVELN